MYKKTVFEIVCAFTDSIKNQYYFFHLRVPSRADFHPGRNSYLPLVKVLIVFTCFKKGLDVLRNHHCLGRDEVPKCKKWSYEYKLWTRLGMELLFLKNIERLSFIGTSIVPGWLEHMNSNNVILEWNFIPRWVSSPFTCECTLTIFLLTSLFNLY